MARAVGATAQHNSAGLSAARFLPALPAALLGIPTGIWLYALVKNGTSMVVPAGQGLVAVALGAIVVLVGLMIIRGRIATRRALIHIFQPETA